jgi:hypothetical protein
MSLARGLLYFVSSSGLLGAHIRCFASTKKYVSVSRMEPQPPAGVVRLPPNRYLAVPLSTFMRPMGSVLLLR